MTSTAVEGSEVLYLVRLFFDEFDGKIIFSPFGLQTLHVVP